MHGKHTAIGAVIWLAACAATRPLEQQHSAEDLRVMLTAPLPRCEEYGLGGWQPDPKCERDAAEERADIRAALDRLHAADVAAAPVCIRQHSLPMSVVRSLGVDPTSPDAVAEAITRGLVIVSLDRSCADAVCKWRKRSEPAKQSAYCPTPSRS